MDNFRADACQVFVGVGPVVYGDYETDAVWEHSRQPKFQVRLEVRVEIFEMLDAYGKF
jgi:hypothetical protein